MIAFRRRFLAALVAVVGTACSAGGGPEAGVSLPTEVRGIVRVTIVVESGAELQHTFLDGRAWLLRTRDMDTQTADILAGVGSNSGLEPGQCTLVDSEQELDGALATVPSRAQVVHLDGGEVLIHAGDTVVGTIAPRHLPALFPYVAGVQYEELWLSDGLEHGFIGGDEVTVSGFGGNDVGPFQVTAQAPELPSEVAVSRGADLEVEWQPARAGGERRGPEPAARAGDRVEVIVGSERGGPELHCAVEDSGSFALRGDLLRGLDGDEVVAVERTRQVGFRAAGLQNGTLEVTVRHVVTDASR